MLGSVRFRAAKKEALERAYVPDGYGGITCCEIDWKQNSVFSQGFLADQYDTVYDFFRKERNVFRDISSCAASC